MSLRKPKQREPFLGIIGNGETIALLSPAGAVDWFCTPRFDSPFVFGRLVDSKSGSFQVQPAEAAATRWTQRYIPGSAILETSCVGPDNLGVFKLSDWMPWGARELRRLISPERSGVRVEIIIQPTFDYRRADHSWDIEIREASGKRCMVLTARSGTQAIRAFIPCECIAAPEELIMQQPSCEGICIPARISAPCEIVIAYSDENGELHEPNLSPDNSLDVCLKFWNSWISRSSYKGKYLEVMQRSLITMKLLTYEKTGAILAAGTSSLPQNPGTGSNWDYRYAWVRDGAFCASAYAEAGYLVEGRAFVDFLFDAMNTRPGEKPWQPLYKIDGDPDCSESDLEHLEGFQGDFPVRIGNLAYIQDQHDAEGEVLDALWDVYNATGDVSLLEKHWEKTRTAADYVVSNWRDTDNGIWELRGVIAHYTHSKVLCWTALDRASLIAARLGHKTESDRWREEADAIKNDVLEHAWNRRMGIFTFAYDMPLTDTSVLVIPLVGMLPADDPRVKSTVRRIEKELVYDRLAARNIFETSPFLLVTYWLARYYIMAGRRDMARGIVDSSMETMTDLLLFCEQAVSASDVIGPDKLTVLRSGIDLLTAYDSADSFFNFVKAIHAYFAGRNPSKDKTPPKKTPKFTKEQRRLFRGNFPQVYSHEELVRVIVRIGS